MLVPPATEGAEKPIPVAKDDAVPAAPEPTVPKPDTPITVDKSPSLATKGTAPKPPNL